MYKFQDIRAIRCKGFAYYVCSSIIQVDGLIIDEILSGTPMN